MARLVLAILALVLATPALAQKAILPDFHADPSAHEWDGRYWIYPSHDVPGSKDWDMVDWHAFSSTDLVDWTDHGVIFSLKDIPWAKRWAWAPDAMKRNGRYYFYVTADDQIGVGVSDKPYGPFKDPLGKPLVARGESGTRVMDPAIFVDDDGQAYLEERALLPLVLLPRGRRGAQEQARRLDIEVPPRALRVPGRLHGQPLPQRPPLDCRLRRPVVPLLPRAGAELVRAAGDRGVPRARPGRGDPAGGDDEGGRAGEAPALEAVVRGDWTVWLSRCRARSH